MQTFTVPIYDRYSLAFLISVLFSAFVYSNSDPPLVGYFLIVAVSCLFLSGFIFTSDPRDRVGEPGEKERRAQFVQLTLNGSLFIIFGVLIWAPTSSRDMGQIGGSEWYLYVVGVLSWITVFVVLYAWRKNRLTYESLKLILLLMLVAVFSATLHYNMVYEVGEIGVTRDGTIDFAQNFTSHFSKYLLFFIIGFMGIGLLRFFGGSHVSRSLESLIHWTKKPTRRYSLLSFLLVIPLFFCFAYQQYLIYALMLCLPVCVFILAQDRMQHPYARWAGVLFSFSGVVLCVYSLKIDKGFGSTMIVLFLLLILAYWGRYAKAKGWWSWLSWGPVFVTLLLLLAPLIMSSITQLDLGGTFLQTFQQRGFAMFYPIWDGEVFTQQMAATQVLMRDAVRYGGLTGDGFWHNKFYISQANTDMVLATNFFYFGIFGYFVLLVVAAIGVQVGRMVLKKDLYEDRDRSILFMLFGFSVFLAIVLPCLWILGALALRLPLTGIVFPFLARGNQFQLVLLVLLLLMVFLDTNAGYREAKGKVQLGGGKRLRAWFSEENFLLRFIRWTVVLLGGLGLYYTLCFFVLVHAPILFSKKPDVNYIVVPENENDVYRITNTSNMMGSYRVGNAILKASTIGSKDGPFLDNFLYISEYSFSRSEIAGGISIGGAGRISPVLDFRFFFFGGQYVHEQNHIILFWEKDRICDQNHLRLSVKGSTIRIEDTPGAVCDKIPESLKAKPPNRPPIDLVQGAELPSGTVFDVGRTQVKVRLSNDNSERLIVELAPNEDERIRPFHLYAKQESRFVLSESLPNIVGGLQLSRKAIDRERIPSVYASRFENHMSERATISDRRRKPLVFTDVYGGFELADPDLICTVGTHRLEFGLDYIFDAYLSGKRKLLSSTSVWDATKRAWKKEKVEGESLRLTYDIILQRRFNRTMQAYLEQHDAASASAVLLNDKNEILVTTQASGAEPSFHCQPQQGSDNCYFDLEHLREDFPLFDKRSYDSEKYPNPYLRRPLCEAFAGDLVGSTIKGIIYAAALAEDAEGEVYFTDLSSLRAAYIRAMEEDSVNTRRWSGVDILAAEDSLVEFGNYSFKPMHNYARGRVATNIYDAFRFSSNTASSYLALKLHERKKLRSSLQRFGLETPLLLRDDRFEPWTNRSQYVKAEIAYTSKAFDWENDSDVLRIGIGDKIYISLLHMATFYSTMLVNEGEFIHPKLVLQVGSNELQPLGRNVFSQKQALIRFKSMAEAVTEPGGTGNTFQLAVPEIEVIGGKTGTASVVGTLPHRIFIVSFKVEGESYTLAVRVKEARPRHNLAVELAGKLVRDAFFPANR